MGADEFEHVHVVTESYEDNIKRGKLEDKKDELDKARLISGRLLALGITLIITGIFFITQGIPRIGFFIMIPGAIFSIIAYKWIPKAVKNEKEFLQDNDMSLKKSKIRH